MCKVLGCGIDIEELSRFDRYIDNVDVSFMENFCTARELHNVTGNERVRYALSFSCKEAFFKALGVSWTNSGISWKNIELLFSGPDFKHHKVNVYAYAKELLKKNNAVIGETSFDYNEEFVTFQVVIVKTCDDRQCDVNGPMTAL